ncbi:MAG: glycosyltransferase family 9 protein [Oligoflexia bacterium]|nr:glycosyltransferase family 9 protein [Oligoflexia bacterium]
MKILVISLLRLGDILMATSVLRSLRREYPGAELHVLINGQFQSVANIIPFVNKVYSFDRAGIQQILGSQDRNILEAYFRIEDLVEQLQTEGYDQVVNLTHNRLSGWMTALIACPNTRGVVFGVNGKFSVGSGWFEYLNDFTDPSSDNVFHFVDVFHYGAGLSGADRRIELLETKAGAAFAEQTYTKYADKKRILIQACSNENKKTLAPKKWNKLIRVLQNLEPGIQVFILGAPNEKEAVAAICADNPRLIPVICNLEQAYSLIKQGHLLITVDTSIKHIAAATKIKILEISVGSSEYRKTGAYTPGAVILQGVVPCAPCSHRGGCTQPTHECAEKISAEMVAMVASGMLRQDEMALRTLAHEYKDEVLLLKTHVNSRGDWAAYPLAESFSAKEINSWIDRASFKLYLQKTHEKAVGEYGTEGLELKQLLENIFPDRAKQDWVTELKSLEKNVTWFETQVGEFLNKLKSLLGAMHEPSRFSQYIVELEEFCVQAEQSNYFKSYSRQLLLSIKDSSADNNQFQVVKKLREKLSHAHQRTKIELKLIRGLQTGFMEII